MAGGFFLDKLAVSRQGARGGGGRPCRGRRGGGGASRGASPELHTLLPLVAAAVSRVSGAIESDRQRAEAEFLLGLTEAALSASSLDEMLATLCERVARMAGARRATVFLVEDGRLQPTASRYSDGARDLTEWELMRRAPSVLP